MGMLEKIEFVIVSNCLRFEEVHPVSHLLALFGQALSCLLFPSTHSVPSNCYIVPVEDFGPIRNPEVG